MDEDSSTSATNVKSDISALELKIIQQIEHYFGDYNLLHSKYLQKLIGLEDGWIPLQILMMKFKRLSILSTDFKIITTALKKSCSQLMEVSEDGTKIRRTPLKPLPESDAALKEDHISRTVYVERFPYNTTYDELFEFFKDKGNISYTGIYRLLSGRHFNGSVYITFESKDDADNFMKEKSVTYADLELRREWKQDYIKRKREQIKKRNELKEEKEKEEMNGEKDILKGCLLKLSGLGEGTMCEDIKDVLSPYEEIDYVDYKRGNLQAVVRFIAEGAASIALSKASKAVEDGQNIESTKNTLVIQGKVVTAMVIEGEEEEDYWNKVLAREYEKRMHKEGTKQGKGRLQLKRNRTQTETEDSDEMTVETSSSKLPGQDEAVDRPVKQIKIDSDQCTELILYLPSLFLETIKKNLAVKYM